ncbi:SPOR domain-containing protein [Burkholderia vietnamiensis]|uniref:SPOR domain-containing protein n=1 Tax=Burkholderia vietnamiensis TaxID=60552 RepID=UPI001B9376F9|nr:SPOR domain-containing protein [Burkholderia vietnamiensis]MBR7919043.1 SPOR domain-containing protein [Burkholderia vietnamiensis]
MLNRTSSTKGVVGAVLITALVAGAIAYRAGQKSIADDPTTTSTNAQSATEPPIAASNPKFVVQLGSYANAPNAQAWVQKLVTAGVPAYVENKTADDGSAQSQLRAGPFQSKSDAATAVAKIRANGLVPPTSDGGQALTEPASSAAMDPARSDQAEAAPARIWWTLNTLQKCHESNGPANLIESIGANGTTPHVHDYDDRVEVSADSGDGLHESIWTFYHIKDACLSKGENAVKNLADKYR